jgi:hydroxyethylthiazole kinase-like uncharacterized protein yjeF
MRRAYRVEQVRRIEAAAMARFPEGTLMAEAAAGLASTCVDLLGGAYGARVVLLVGAGDNGGDALLAGALLARRGAQVTALLLAGSGHTHVATLRGAGGRIEQVGGSWADASLSAHRALERADLVIDGIVGIGGTGGLRPDAAAVVEAIPVAALVVAVDLPSGIEPDSGEILGPCVRADVTVAMGVMKPGLLVDPGAAAVGALVLVTLPLAEEGEVPEVEALDDSDIRLLLPGRTRHADKYASGVVGIVAGSAQYPGAAVLAVAGAVHGGSGYTRFAGAFESSAAVREAFPEVVQAPRGDRSWSVALEAAGRVQAWVVGPGLGTDEGAVDAVRAALVSDVPVLLDADALTVAADHPDLRTTIPARRAATVLTPHAGELARLLSATRGQDVPRSHVEEHRLATAREAAAALGATVLLKGSTTLVADPDPSVPVRANTTGGPWLASAGTGDVLSGLIGALLSRGLDPRDAASVGAHLHGRAGFAVARSVAESRGPAAQPTASEIAVGLGAH